MAKLKKSSGNFPGQTAAQQATSTAKPSTDNATDLADLENIETAMEASHKTVVSRDKEIGEMAEQPSGPVGLDIHCTGAGTVIYAQTNRHGYGKEVVVDHGFGYTTRYAHLHDIYVKKGQKLSRGEVLGTLGNTGKSTGPHLHYEIRKDERAVNPFYFFYENLSSQEYEHLAARANSPVAPYQPLAMSQK